MTVVTAAAPAPAWSNRDFRRLWRGSAASTLGAEIGELALPLFALVTLSATAAEASVLRIAQFLPFLVATLPAGLLVDRLRRARLRLMIGADVCRGVLLALVPLLAWAGAIGMPALYAVVFAQCRSAYFDLDGGWVGLSGAGVVGFLDAVCVVAHAFDDAGVGAVSAGAVQVAVVGDVVADGGDELVSVVRGKRPPGR